MKSLEKISDFLLKIFFSKLTIKNTAASSVNLHLTSRSIGKVIPKLSASVNNSLAGPDHCFVTFPTSSPFVVKTYAVETQYYKDSKLLHRNQCHCNSKRKRKRALSIPKVLSYQHHIFET